MRVIAGNARSLILKTLPGLETRPTTDRIKETLFNMIQFDIPGSRFLDLYAGSGGIGIEALSRGAKEAVFVDNNPKAVSCIRDNLLHTKFADHAEVINSDAVSALTKLNAAEKKPFNIIFMDPPYGMGLEDRALAFLSGSSLLDSGTILIIEMKIHSDIDHFSSLPFEIMKVKEYKTNQHVFLKFSNSGLSERK